MKSNICAHKFGSRCVADEDEQAKVEVSLFNRLRFAGGGRLSVDKGFIVIEVGYVHQNFVPANAPLCREEEEVLNQWCPVRYRERPPLRDHLQSKER